MPRTGRKALALSLALCAVGVSACGDEGDGTIPPQNGETLLATLDQVEQAVNANECTTARTDAQQLLGQVNQLPKETGVETKETLRVGAESLIELVDSQCQEPTGPSGEDTFVPPPEEETTVPPVEEESAVPPPAEEDSSGEGGGNGPPGPGGNPNEGEDGDSGGVGGD